jgi:DHA2 family multidrug resistance protein-like MFS transporter
MTRRQVAALFALCLAVFMVAVDGTVISVAVPAITEELHPSYNEILWIGDIYSFVLAGLLITMGNVGDRIGRKRLLLISSVAFGVASVLAAVAPTAALLIVARAVQGFAGAGLMPATLALLRAVFTDDRQRMRGIGIWSAAGAAGAALGPTVAGVLLEHFFWGSVLLVNLPVVALVVGVGVWVLPEARSDVRHPLDPASVLLSTAGILGVVYGITELAHTGLDFWPAYPALIIGAVLVVVFLQRQRRLPVPLLDLELFTQPKFSAAISAQLLTVFANVGALFFVPIYLRQVSDFSTLQSGIALLPDSLASVVAATNTGRLVRKWGDVRVMLLGVALGGVGLIGLGITLPISYPAIVIPLVLIGVSFALVVTAGSDIVLNSASEDRVGAATGISEAAFELGNALGIALIGSVVAVLYFLSTGTPANLTYAVDGRGFSSAMTGTAVISGVLLLVTTVIVARAFRAARSAAESVP